MPKFAFRHRRQSAPRPEERRRRGWRPVARHGGTALWSLAGLLAGGLLLGLMLWHGGGGNGAPGGYGGPVAEAQTICDEGILPIEGLQALIQVGICDPLRQRHAKSGGNANANADNDASAKSVRRQRQRRQ